MDKKIHIGLFLYSLEDMGGAVRVAVSLANRMAEDFQVTVIELTNHTSMAFPLHAAVDVVSLKSKQQRIRGRISEVKALMGKFLKDVHIDVMLGIGAEETSVAILPCRSSKTPLIFCDHGALINQLDDKSTTLLRAVCAHMCYKTVVLTSQTKDDYQRILRIRSDKLVHIPNWIPNELVQQGLTCDVSAKRILWAGRLDGEKGIDHLLRIARLVMPKMPDWQWDIYGEAVLHNAGFDLGEELEGAHLVHQVRLCGKYAHTRDVFPAYSIGALTSYREGLPLFLLEGLAYGLPLISFDIDTGPRDLITEGKNGYLIAPYDCEGYADILLSMMNDYDMRVRMSQASLKKACEFSEDSVYVQWVGLIRSACAGAGT